MSPALHPAGAAPGTADPLAGLHGYHLPTPVSWWPPAPGWWLLAVVVLALLVATATWLLRRYRRRAALRAACRELQTLRATVRSDGDALAFVRGVSRLLRRFALSRFPRAGVAGLAGSEWLAFLDNHGGGGRFGNGPGRVLVEAPYRPTAEIPAQELADLAESWIRHNREAQA
jgi:hypothetical protein